MSITLSGRIDSNNAAVIEESLLSQLSETGEPVLDAEKLSYISSAGLRVLLRILKKYPDLKVINVSHDVYDIFNMTGFTEIMTVEKTYQSVSIDGCEVIGRGANGTLYRIGKDTVVKVYKYADALDEIRNERENAKLALILGIPTAISYDIVRVGDSYGSVFELLNAQSFSWILAHEPDKFDWCVDEFVRMLKRIHETVVPGGKLPDMRDTVLSWVEFMQEYLPEETGKKLVSMVEAVPRSDRMLHGDYHTKNLELQDDEVLLIDMDTLSVGHPIFEFASMFNAFIGFSETDHSIIRKFQGYDFETGSRFWRRTLAEYLGTTCESKLKEVEDKARIIGYTRLLRRSIRRDKLKTELERKTFEYRKEQLLSLLNRIDTLLFRCDELIVPADDAHLDEVQTFVKERLSAADSSPRALQQIELAVEEIFINIASYAYGPEGGEAVIRVNVENDPAEAIITFLDRGVPYDPLKKPDPDVTLSAEQRRIGGLGVFLTKQFMDDVRYEYRDGQNVLTLVKRTR